MSAWLEPPLSGDDASDDASPAARGAGAAEPQAADFDGGYLSGSELSGTELSGTELSGTELIDRDAVIARDAIERMIARAAAAPKGALGVSASGLDGDPNATFSALLQARSQLDALITIGGMRADSAGEIWNGFSALLRTDGKATDAEVRATTYAGLSAQEYPLLAAHWVAGRISAAQVRTIGQLASKLSLDDRDRAVELLAHYAPDLTAAELSRAAKTLLNAVSPGFEERAAERAEEESFLQIATDLTGYRISGHLTNEQAGWVQVVLDALTGVVAAGDMRTKSQRQAEALVTVMRQYANSDSIPQLAMARPQLIIMAQASDLLAMANDAAPGDLPVTAWNDTLSPSTTRRIMSECDIVPVVVDETQNQTLVDVALDAANAERVKAALALLTKRRRSKQFADRTAPPVFLRLLTTPVVPLAMGRRVRTVTDKLRQAVTLRDQHCVVTGCTMPVHRCEIHHVVPWALGGPTDLDNLAALCVRHHRNVETGKWRLRRRLPEDGPGRYWVSEFQY